MGKGAQSIIRHSCILLVLVALLACYNASWAGVAAYQLDGGTTLPAPVSYWLSGDATSVTIDIIDAVTSAVSYTFPVLTGADATKGFHSGAVTWSGEANGGGLVTPGNYKIRATVISDMSGTDLKPIWEKPTLDSDGWRVYGIAMNRNPDSHFYGRVYVGNFNALGHSKAVHEFNPDGSEIGPLPLPDPGYGANGPWGLCVDADDHVYVSNRSNADPGGTAGPAVWQYYREGSQWVCGPRINQGLSYQRYLDCNYASGAALKLLVTYQEGTVVRIYTGVGDWPTAYAKSADYSIADLPMQSAIDAGGAVYVAGYNSPSPLVGALTQWNYSSRTLVGRNANLTQATGLSITIDDATMWMARPGMCLWAGQEQSQFYKFPKSMAMTIAPDDANLHKFGWASAYNIPTVRTYPRFISVDGQSNLAIASVDLSLTSWGSVFGLYAEPTGPNASEVRVGRNTIVKGINPTISGVITEGISGKPAAGVTVRATKGGYFREAVTDADGAYLIEVMPNTGYTIAPVTNIYENTLPTEYNLQSNWPSTPGATDWPITADAISGPTTVNGRVWPLAVTQATYDWAVPVYRAGGRTVCVTGTILRQAADSTVTPNQQGYNGYYFLADMLGASGHDTEQAVKVKVFLKGSECRKGDKVVVIGTFDPPAGYNQGVITPTSAPTVLSSGNAFPEPRDATSLTYATLYHNLIGGWYVMNNMTITRVGTGGDFYVQVPTSSTNPTPIEFRIDIDSISTTGVTRPTVGQVIDIYGVLDELAPASNTSRALRPGEPGDAGPQGLVSEVAAAKIKANGADVAMAGAQVTAVAGGGVPTDIAYIEQPNRTAALRVHAPNLASDIGPGDLVMIQGRMFTTAQGERFIEAVKFSRIAVGASARPVDAVGMGNSAAISGMALGMFIKTWGKVGTVGADSFTISDGSPTPIKVMCGSLAKPDAGRVVRVRGIMSKDTSGPVLYMKNERVDWQYGEEAYQPIPFPGAYKYPRDFLVVGPFADANSVPGADPQVARAYRLNHDFIYDATGDYDEQSMLYLRPSLGGSVGTKTWLRSQPTGDNANFAVVFPTGNTNCTFYAHLWLYSPTYATIGMRVGSCGCAKVIVNGYQVYATSTSVVRAESQGEDAVNYCSLNPGLNSVLLKVEHGTNNTPGIDIQFVDPAALGGPGWGKAVPLQGYGYLLDPL